MWLIMHLPLKLVHSQFLLSSQLTTSICHNSTVTLSIQLANLLILLLIVSCQFSLLLKKTIGTSKCQGFSSKQLLTNFFVLNLQATVNSYSYVSQNNLFCSFNFIAHILIFVDLFCRSSVVRIGQNYVNIQEGSFKCCVVLRAPRSNSKMFKTYFAWRY